MSGTKRGYGAIGIKGPLVPHTCAYGDGARRERPAETPGLPSSGEDCDAGNFLAQFRRRHRNAFVSAALFGTAFAILALMLDAMRNAQPPPPATAREPSQTQVEESGQLWARTTATTAAGSLQDRSRGEDGTGQAWAAAPRDAVPAVSGGADAGAADQ
ncbi:unnamed protein product, partial [Phaeothamnion confervicola]